MVGIYKYERGLQFTGMIANTEEDAWEYLDKKYEHYVCGFKFGCNREAFEIMPIENVSQKI